MQINNTYRVNNITVPMGSMSTPVGNNLPSNQPSNVEMAMATRYEINKLLQQFTEWVRIESESRRMEILHRILMKERNETSDLFGKIMDIARRIMRSEPVSLEEMSLLAEQYPQLMFIVSLLKNDVVEEKGRDRRYEEDRRLGDRRRGSRRRKDGSRNRHLSHRKESDTEHQIMLFDMATRISYIKALKSVKKSSDS